MARLVPITPSASINFSTFEIGLFRCDSCSVSVLFVVVAVFKLHEKLSVEYQACLSLAMVAETICCHTLFFSNYVSCKVVEILAVTPLITVLILLVGLEITMSNVTEPLRVLIMFFVVLLILNFVRAILSMVVFHGMIERCFSETISIRLCNKSMIGMIYYLSLYISIADIIGLVYMAMYEFISWKTMICFIFSIVFDGLR